jgi:hypothetical protein
MTIEEIRERRARYTAKWRAANPEKYKEAQRKRNHKWRVEDPQRARDKDREKNAKRRAANPEKSKEHSRKSSREWRDANPEKWREISRKASHKWRAANPEKRKEIALKWRQSNPEKNSAYATVRRTFKRRAVVKWADPMAIRALYLEAKRLTAETGITHHVDHVVPLNHSLVCGLHCESNLQVLPKRDNLSKGNRWWPDMPQNCC